MQLTKQDLIDFEKEIANIFAEGKIKAPVHLRAGREEQLIDFFKAYNIDSSDWVLGYWDAHELALLKGIPRDQVKASILAGNSIALCFPNYNFLCSGIVGSLMGTAVGIAWALRKQDKMGHVYHFCGDMSAETGIFHESVKYAYYHSLPVTFIVCDNGLSVMTKTREVWNYPVPWFKGTKFQKQIVYFQYENGYPHSGLGKMIKF